METNDMKKCPYCAELIKKEAIKCRYCGSMLTEKKVSFDFLSTPGYWHRVSEGKKIAGVCTGIARQLDSPVLILPLRVFFVLTTIFYGFGFILYIILWALMAPPTDGQPSMGTTVSPNQQSPSSGPAAPAPESEPESPDDDFDYIEGSTPAPEEFKPSPESTSSDEDSGNETNVQKRMMLWGVCGLLMIVTLFAGRAYIALMMDLGFSIPFQLVLIGLLIGMGMLTMMPVRICTRQVPVPIAADC